MLRSTLKFTEVADVTADVLTCETDRSADFLGSQFVCYLYASTKED